MIRTSGRKGKGLISYPTSGAIGEDIREKISPSFLCLLLLGLARCSQLETFADNFGERGPGGMLLCASLRPSPSLLNRQRPQFSQ